MLVGVQSLAGEEKASTLSHPLPYPTGSKARTEANGYPASPVASSHRLLLKPRRAAARGLIVTQPQGWVKGVWSDQSHREATVERVVGSISALVSAPGAATLSFWQCRGPPFTLLLVRTVTLGLLLSQEDPATSTWAFKFWSQVAEI